MPADTTKPLLAAAHAALVRGRIGGIITAERLRLGISVSELARLAGIPQQTVNEYVSGNSEPSLSRAIAIERALKRPVGWLAKQLVNS